MNFIFPYILYILIKMLQVRKFIKPYRMMISITTIKEPSIHNPFQSLPLEELLKLASKTDATDGQSHFFYECFYRTIIDNQSKLKPNIIQQINREVNRMMIQIIKYMKNVDIETLLLITERICEGINKKVLIVEKKILISYFTTFQSTLIPILESDQSGKYQKHLKSLLPHILEARKGTTIFNHFVAYIFQFAELSNYQNLYEFLELMLSQYQKANHSITISMFNFLTKKIAPFMETENQKNQGFSDALLLKFFTTYQFHLKKPEFGLPQWFRKYLEGLKNHYEANNLEISEIEKLEYLEMRMQLWLNVSFPMRVLYLNRREVLYIFNYFWEMYNIVQEIPKVVRFQAMNKIMDILILYEEFIKKYHYFEFSPMTGKDIVQRMIREYLSYSVDFEQLTSQQKKFFQKLIRFIRLFNLQFSLSSEIAIIKFLEKCLETMSAQHDNFLFFTEMYADKYLKAPFQINSSVKNKIQLLDQNVDLLRIFEVFRYYYITKALNISMPKLKQAFKYEIYTHPDIYTRSVSRSMLYNLNYQDVISLFDAILENPKMNVEKVLKTIFPTMKIRYPSFEDETIRETLLNQLLSKKKFVKNQLKSPKTWDSLYFHFRNPNSFSSVQIYQIDLLFSMVRKCQNQAFFSQKIYSLFKDRVCQSGWLLKENQIFKIKYFNFFNRLRQVNFFQTLGPEKQDYLAPFLYYPLHSGISFLAIHSDQNIYMREKLFNLMKDIVVEGKQKWNRSYKGIIDKIWLWFHSQGWGLALFDEFPDFPSLTLIKYLEQYYNSLYLLNFSLFCQHNKKPIPKQMQKLSSPKKQQKNIYNFIDSDQICNLSYEEVVQLFLVSEVVKILPSEHFKYIIRKLISCKQKLTYEEFSLVVCTIRLLSEDHIFEQELKEIGTELDEWIKSQFLCYTSSAPQNYLNDYLSLSQWLGSIIPYSTSLPHYIQHNLKKGSVFLPCQLLARKHMVKPAILMQFIKKLSIRMVWQIALEDKDLWEKLVFPCYAWIIMHEDIHVLDCWAVEVLIKAKPKLFSAQAAYILHMFGKVALTILEQSKTKSEYYQQTHTILQNSMGLCSSRQLQAQLQLDIQPYLCQRQQGRQQLPNTILSLPHEQGIFYYPYSHNPYIDIVTKYLQIVSGCRVQKKKTE